MKTFRYLFLFFLSIVLENVQLMAQKVNISDREVLTRHIWTDGFEFVRNIPPENSKIMGIPNPAAKDTSLLFLVGGSLHEGGTHLCLQKRQGQFVITQKGDDAYQWFPIGDILTLDSLRQNVLIRNEKNGQLHGVLQILPDFDALRPLMQEDLRIYGLSGTYTDERGRQYVFSTKENQAHGFPSTSPTYQFGELYDIPAMILIFQEKTYRAHAAGQWMRLTPVQATEEGYYPLRGEKEIFLKRVLSPDEYAYPMLTKKMLTARQLLLYAGIAAISYHSEEYRSSMEHVIQSLKAMRNEIYARHGYIFKNKEWREFFEKRTWYHPVKQDITYDLSEIEQTNIEHLSYLQLKMEKELDHTK